MDERVVLFLSSSGRRGHERSVSIVRGWRSTGYKIFNRYRQEGLEALSDRSRRPVRYANQFRPVADRAADRRQQAGQAALACKIREVAGAEPPAMCASLPRAPFSVPLDRHGLVSQARKRNRANKAAGTPLSQAAVPNDLWCTDFKGEFMTGDGRYCYPLTVTDQASRYVLACEALESNDEDPVIEAFLRLFRERGLLIGQPLRQWTAFRLAQRPLQPVEALRLLAPPRHRHRAHQAGPSATERPP